MFHWYRLTLVIVTAVAPALAAFAPKSLQAPALARQVAEDAGVQRDPSLNEAARIHARDIVKDRNRARWERVKAALRREGVADAQFWPVAVVGGERAALVRQLRAAAREQGRVLGATHVGLGVARNQTRGVWAVVALFVRRLVRMSPLSDEPSARGVVIRGRTDIGTDLEALWMGPCHDTACQGGVRRLRVEPGQEGWTLNVPPMRGPGTWTLELMVETARGPEPATLWRFGRDLRGEPPPGPPQRWVERFRARQDLAPLEPHRALTRAARRHARRVCDSRVAAHILPDGADPQHRATDEGYVGSVTENVAVAPSAAAAHRDLLRSPSHRRNIIDPAAVHYGMAIATASATAGARAIHCWVEMYGHPHR